MITRFPRIFLPALPILIVLHGLATPPPDTAAALLAADPPCAPLAAHGIAWWPFDQAEGDTVAPDLLGGHHGKVAGSGSGTSGSGIQWQPGLVNGSIAFTGLAPSLVTVPHHPDLDLGPTQFSLDAWVYFPAGTTNGMHQIVHKHQVPQNYGYTVAMRSNRYELLLRHPAGMSRFFFTNDRGVVATDRWQHVAITVNRTRGPADIRFYVDGVHRPLGPHSANPATIANWDLRNTGDLRIGHGAVDPWRLDELHLYQRVLTAAQVKSIFDAGASGFCKPSCAPVPADSTAWWPLDETAGTTAADIWVHANHGTVAGPEGWDPAGKVSGAHYFSGIDGSHIDVPDDPSLNFGAGDFSVDAWMRLPAAPQGIARALVDKRLQIGRSGYHLYYHHLGGASPSAQSLVGIQLADGSGYRNYAGTSPAPLNDGQWHHVAATVKRSGGSGAGVRVYVDGVLIAFNPTALPGSVSSTSHLRLGANAIGGQPFEGWLDEVQLYARALGHDEILAIYDAGSLGKCRSDCAPPGPPSGGDLSLAPGHAVALPALGLKGEDDVCSTWIQTQNGGAVGTYAILVAFGEASDCVGADGPVGVACSGLIAPGAAWAFTGAMLPVGSLSGIVYSVADGSYGGEPIAATVCDELSAIATDAEHRSFHAAYLGGGTVAGIPMSSARGQALAVVVHRRCPADMTPGQTVASAYEGIADAMLETPASSNPDTYRYRVPLVVSDRHGYTSYIYLQNFGAVCAQVQVALRALDSCLPAEVCQLESAEIPPGRTLSIDPLHCASDWEGDVEITSNVPLAVASDIVGHDALATFRGISAVPSPGARDLVGPLMFHPQHAWDTQVWVQNLGCEPAEARVTFHDEGGAVIHVETDTLCPNASGRFLLPASNDAPGLQAGWIRVESLAGTVAQKQPLTAVVWLTKYTDVARTMVLEASAYNVLPARELSGGEVGLPFAIKDLSSSGLTSAVQLTGGPEFGSGSSGTETLQRMLFDPDAPVLSDTVPVSVGSSSLQILGTMGAVPDGLHGSMTLTDAATLARFAAAGLVRDGGFPWDNLGDETAVYVAVPLRAPTE